MLHLHRTWAVLSAWVTLVNAVQRARLFRSEVTESPVKVTQSTHMNEAVQSNWNPDKPTMVNQATFLSSSSHQAQLPGKALDRSTVMIGKQGSVHSLISMGQEDWMVANRSGQSSTHTRAASIDHARLPAPAAWRSPKHRRVPHADADNYAGRRRTSIIIQSSGSVRAAATTGPEASLVQDLQVPATVATVAPALAATAAPVPVVAAVTVAPALAATVAPVAVAPVAGAAVPAVTAAPAEGGGSMGSLFIFLALFAVVAAGVALAMKLRNQNRPGGRLGGMQGGMQDASGGGESQFWKSAKTRQSYRSTAITKSANSKGSMSTSDDDAASSAQKGSAAAAQEAPSASDDSKRPTGDTGSSKGADSASTKKSYSDRKGARQALAEKGSRAASNG